MNRKAKKKVFVAMALACVLSVSASQVTLYDFSSITASAATKVLTVEETKENISDIAIPRPNSTSPVALKYDSSAGFFKEGIYYVPVYMYAKNQSTDDGTDPSMANGALRHLAKIEIKDKQVAITVSFDGIQLSEDGFVGHLLQLWYYNNNNQLIEVADNYAEYDYVYDESDLTKFEKYLENATIVLEDLGTKKKPVYSSDILCKIHVDAMGDSLQECYLVIDWNNLYCPYWENVLSLIDSCESISNDDGIYTEESYRKLVNAIDLAKSETKKWNATLAYRHYIAIKKAKNGLISTESSLENGVYSAPVKYYNVIPNDVTGSNTSTITEYIVTDTDNVLMESYFGNNVTVTAEDGKYILNLTPIETPQ